MTALYSHYFNWIEWDWYWTGMALKLKKLLDWGVLSAFAYMQLNKAWSWPKLRLDLCYILAATGIFQTMKLFSNIPGTQAGDHLATAGF